MPRVLRFAQAAGVNAVSVGGFFAAGWSPATVLSVYWFENVLGSLLVAARIAIHRRLTGKRGHYEGRGEASASSFRSRRLARLSGERARAGAERRRRREPLRRPPRPTDGPVFLHGFVLVSLVFSLAHAVFLAVVMWGILRLPVERGALADGVLAVAVVQVASFVGDLRGLGGWPFATLKESAGRAFGRVALVHLSVIGGMAMLAWRGEPRSFFGIFVALKLLADLTSVLPTVPADGERPPRWLARVMGRFGVREEFEHDWRESSERERREAEEDEQVWDASAGRWVPPDAPRRAS